VKGLIFTSFLSYVEEQFGLEFVDQMLDAVPVQSSGIYTTVGTYNHEELIKYIIHIHAIKELEIPVMIEAFGYYLFTKLSNQYPQLIEQFTNSLECIFHIDQTIHRNVTKIHPNAELPTMDAFFNDDKNELTLNYDSKRPFMFLAKGLIQGCIDYYGEEINVSMIDLSNGQSNKAQFILT
jgi:hypothetical protein